MKDDNPENVQDQKKYYADIAYEYGRFLNLYLNKTKESIEI